MKQFFKFLLLILFALLAGCRGEPGYPGIDGKDGQDGKDGDSFIGLVFNGSGDFTSENEYTLYFQFPGNITVYDSDVVLVYILWEQMINNYGDPIDIWRLLPQTVVLDEGVLQYNYDYTYADVQIFLEGTIDLETLLPGEALNQYFRIVILPAAFISNNNLNVADYNMLVKSLEMKNIKLY